VKLKIHGVTGTNKLFYRFLKQAFCRVIFYSIDTGRDASEILRKKFDLAFGQSFEAACRQPVLQTFLCKAGQFKRSSKASIPGKEKVFEY
jgi:hypothetical protein